MRALLHRLAAFLLEAIEPAHAPKDCPRDCADHGPAYRRQLAERRIPPVGF